MKETPDFVNANAWEVIRKSPAKPQTPNYGENQYQYQYHHQHQSNNNKSGVSNFNRNFGRIPKYLLERKEQWAREEEERRLNAPDPDCPSGMMLLDEDERLRTLRVLRKSLDEARLQMNYLPLRIETPSQIRRKNVLEAKLQEIEDAIKVFDRSKVYVAIPLDSDSSDSSSVKKANLSFNASRQERYGAAA